MIPPFRGHPRRRSHAIALAIVLGTLASFIYNGISWEALPWHRASIGVAHDEDSALACLQDQLDGSGVYLVPHPPAQPEDARERSMQRLLDEPAAFVAWRTDAFSMPAMFGKELARQLFSTILLTLLLLGFVGPGIGRKTLAAALAGGFAAMAAHLQGWVHFYFSDIFVLWNVVDAVVGTTLTGFIIAKTTGR